MLIDDLKFQVEDDAVIEKNFNIEDKVFFIHSRAQQDWICNFGGKNFIRMEMKQGTNQSFQSFVAGLEEGAEKVIIGHTDRYRPRGGAEKVRKFRRCRKLWKNRRSKDVFRHNGIPF